MEWALGIGIEGRRFVARVARGGHVESVPLDDIWRRGLPAPGSTRRNRETLNFSHFEPADSSKYCAATGIDLPVGEPNQHQVFEVRVAKRTFVIPALVLMRALFRPTRYLLPTMFGPQALDRVGWVSQSAGGTSLFIDAPWGKASRAGRYSDSVGQLSWMFAHPSSRTMSDSVHTNALKGAIAMSLPDATCTGVFYSVGAGHKRYVTSCSLHKIQPVDLPIVQLTGLESTVTLVESPVLHHTGSCRAKPLAMRIPARPDGSMALSEHEWTLIEPVLKQGRARDTESELSQRAILDGVLAKLANGTPWRSSRFAEGTWCNASFAYRTWSERGAFAEVLRVLEAVRLGP
jgi:hypothetical protein